MSYRFLKKRFLRASIVLCLTVFVAVATNAFAQPAHARNESTSTNVLIHFNTPDENATKTMTARIIEAHLASSPTFFEGDDLSQLSSNSPIDASKVLAGATSAEIRLATLKARSFLAQKEARKLISQNTSARANYFWITNTIQLEAPRELIAKIANLDSVDVIRDNKALTTDPGVKARRSRRSADATTQEIEQNLSAIRADKVWKDFHIDGSGVVVGIVDQAIDLEHPALKRHFAGYNAQNNSVIKDNSYFDVLKSGLGSDDHGTHVAGIIVGSETRAHDDGTTTEYNRIGVAPGAKFIAARAFKNGVGATNENVIKACQWMLAPNGDPSKAPRIINQSWSDGSNKQDPWFDDMARAIRDAGILNVMSAGNNGIKPAEPGSVDNPATSPLVFTVGATDNNGKLASFSRRGPSANPNATYKPDLVAPGVAIRSALPNNSYASWNGTSMAAPEVSGVAALMLQANPNLTLDEMEDILRSTARPLTDATYTQSPNQGYGYGMVDAYAAVKKALQKAGKLPESQNNSSISGIVSAKSPSASDQDIERELGALKLSYNTSSFVDRPMRMLLNVEKAEGLQSAVLKLTIGSTTKTYTFDTPNN